MKTYRQFIKEQRQINERIARKGAVSAFALQGKRHGDEAVRHYRSAKLTTDQNSNAEDIGQQLKSLKVALRHIADGLLSTRFQIGSVSSQITASTVMD